MSDGHLAEVQRDAQAGLPGRLVHVVQEMAGDLSEGGDVLMDDQLLSAINAPYSPTAWAGIATSSVVKLLSKSCALARTKPRSRNLTAEIPKGIAQRSARNLQQT